MTGEDILSVLFLALICIVIAGLVMNLSPKELIIPSFAFIAISLWIAYDYMLLNRYKVKVQQVEKAYESDLKKVIDDINNDTLAGGPIDENNLIAEPNKQVAPPEKQSLKEFEIDMYNNAATIQDMYKQMGCTGDNMIANRMKYMALQAQASQVARAGWNARSFQPYVEEELRQASQRDWWENDALNAQF